MLILMRKTVSNKNQTKIKQKSNKIKQNQTKIT